MIVGKFNKVNKSVVLLVQMVHLVQVIHVILLVLRVLVLSTYSGTYEGNMTYSMLCIANVQQLKNHEFMNNANLL